ncbi:protein of unknown function [Nitrospira japonica]|uniref:Uncharacterized protein n=1 Tax=Nitrospira japonica TaxID=1325564 RepID=A0A1W1I5I8_9BACT|nr:protein of unknown function [Nitrospira japonica]
MTKGADLRLDSLIEGSSGNRNLPWMHGEYRRLKRGVKASPVEKPLAESPDLCYALARPIHDRFYCNRRYAAATSLAASFRKPSGQAWRCG